MVGLSSLTNPVPRGLANEAQKAAKILEGFIDPRQAYGPDQVIPPSVLRNAKGLVIISILKAGFLFSGRAGSGIIVARLRDGTWSAPSAIAMGGAGAGGLIGMELTEFVFILNTDEVVDSFSEFGTVTLGGNVSVAAGPVGRDAEADASASAAGIASVFTYSKSKGLFAGVSVEGSAIVERRDENRKVYGDRGTTRRILNGEVEPLPSMDRLYRILESPTFTPQPGEGYRTSSYSEEQARPDERYGRERYDRRYDEPLYDEKPRSRVRWDSGDMPHSRGGVERQDHLQRNDYDSHNRGGYPPPPCERNKDVQGHGPDSHALNRNRPVPPPPPAERSFPKVRALYDFNGQQQGDLSFKKDDIIVVQKKTDSHNDWWYGVAHGVEGVFPANYVEDL